MTWLLIGAVAVLVFVYLCVRAARDPETRVAERAADGDPEAQAELEALIRMRYMG